MPPESFSGGYVFYNSKGSEMSDDNPDKQSLDEIDCPYCAEKIKASAKKCRHCSEVLDSQMREISYLRNNQQGSGQIIVNSAASATAPSFSQRIPFSHTGHLLLTLITAGIWFPGWVLCYVFRNRSVYF